MKLLLPIVGVVLAIGGAAAIVLTLIYSESLPRCGPMPTLPGAAVIPCDNRLEVTILSGLASTCAGIAVLVIGMRKNGIHLSRYS